MISPRLAVLWIATVIITTTTNAQEPVFELHGAGAAAPCLNLIMDLVTDRSRSPVRLTYREIANTTAAQTEYRNAVKGGNDIRVDFGAGHVPLNQFFFDELKAESKNVLHFPHVLSAVGLYHSIDAILEGSSSSTATAQLNLTSCLIAKIYQREIVSWKDEAIIAENPLLKDLPDDDSDIVVIRQNLASPVTAGMSEYLRMSCPASWPASMVGDDIDWPVGVINCATDMSFCLEKHKNSIGFTDVSHALQYMAQTTAASRIAEVPLKNKEGRYHTSAQASKLGGLEAAALTVIPSAANDSFSAVNLIYQDGPDTWPIVTMNYVYVAANLAAHGLAPKGQGLMVAFLQALYETPYVYHCQTKLGLTPVPEHVRKVGMQGIELLKGTNPNARLWQFERLASADAPLQPGELVLSERRTSFHQSQLYELVDDVHLLKTAGGSAAALQAEIEQLTTLNTALNAHVLNLLNRVVKLEEENAGSQQQSPIAGVISNPTPAPQQQSTPAVNLRPINVNMLDDDTAIDAATGLPIFDDKAESQLQASLTLGSMSFTFWAIYFTWKTWRFFLKP